MKITPRLIVQLSVAIAAVARLVATVQAEKKPAPLKLGAKRGRK